MFQRKEITWIKWRRCIATYLQPKSLYAYLDVVVQRIYSPKSFTPIKTLQCNVSTEHNSLKQMLALECNVPTAPKFFEPIETLQCNVSTERNNLGQMLALECDVTAVPKFFESFKTLQCNVSTERNNLKQMETLQCNVSTGGYIYLLQFYCLHNGWEFDLII